MPTVNLMFTVALSLIDICEAAGFPFIDGSKEADLPMQQLSEIFNINDLIFSHPFLMA